MHVCSAECDILNRGAVPVTVQHEVHRVSTITPPHARNDQQAALHHRASYPTLTDTLSTCCLPSRKLPGRKPARQNSHRLSLVRTICRVEGFSRCPAEWALNYGGA
ncbi:unnamed protein product [Polarella glacialis]|uniref:Uncharacterized protein n=1 Tax=Polarella glacialis TaxID=89957 RepID=A0A813J6P0_POLGL|nr:unnamed protein product [Polarella glacialis]